MAAVKAGDRVHVIKRPVTADDAKTGLYYEYFGGLTGTVDRVYDDHSVCIDVDLESLQPAAQQRHAEMQEAERKRWLEGLSNDVRSRLTPEQQKLKMSYKILVGAKDLQPLAGGGPAKPTKQPKPESKPEIKAPDKPVPKASGPAKAAQDPKMSSARAPAPPKPAAPVRQTRPASEEPPKRLSQAELDKREQEFLESLKAKK